MSHAGIGLLSEAPALPASPQLRTDPLQDRAALSESRLRPAYTPAVVPITPIVDFRGLGVRVGDTLILRGVDLRVEAGDVIGIHGANGSGKTTLLRLPATLLAPTEGQGSVLGADLFGSDRFEVRPRIEMVGHQPALYPNLTLEENTAFVARITGQGAARAAELLERVGLGGAQRRRVDQCSHGMQRRAEFARVMLTEPDLLLLDEAHAGLDPQAAELVGYLMKSVAARGGAAIYVTHDAARAADLVDRAYEVGGGRLEPLP